MLMIDDIQFIAGKEATQTEFFHTFDALYEDKKRSYSPSDRPPRELESLEQRIRSRFEQGLLADIKPPDYELRMAILRNKMKPEPHRRSDSVVDLSRAESPGKTSDKLEGVIKKLVDVEPAHGTAGEHGDGNTDSAGISRDAEPVSTP